MFETKEVVLYRTRCNQFILTANKRNVQFGTEISYLVKTNFKKIKSLELLDPEDEGKTIPQTSIPI
jgi:hypothetical protein